MQSGGATVFQSFIYLNNTENIGESELVLAQPVQTIQINALAATLKAVDTIGNFSK